MRTQAQIEASRANGRRSQGPVTPEGKARSALNAYRHGLLAHTMVLRTEDKEAFGQYLDQHLERWQPFDDVEMNLVEEMVGAAWRGRRAAGMQTMVYDAEIAAIEPSGCGGNDLVDAFNRLAASPALRLFHRYETHYHRIYHRCIATLMKLQKARPAAAPAEVAEAELPNEPKPAIPNEPKPAPPNEPKPAIPTEPKPAIPNEPKPAVPNEPKDARSATNPQPPAPNPQPQFSYNSRPRLTLLKTGTKEASEQPPTL
jgi:hypothetical protein